MKQLVLVFILLLCVAHSSLAQTKHPTRSPYVHSFASVQHAGGERGDAPANDDCANAQAITVTADCDSPTSGDNTEATNDGADASCDDPGADLLDVWYSFNTGAEDTVAITLTPGPDMEDWAFALYDGCAGAEVACVIVPFAPLNVAVSPNTDYWLRVYSNPTYGVGGAFTICVTGAVVVAPPPPNDECIDVVPQAIAVGSTVTFLGDNTGATDTEGLGQGSAWEAFTLAQEADITIDLCGTAPAFPDYFLVVFTDCLLSGAIYPGSYDTTACGDNNGSLCFTGLAAGTYYYPVLAGVSSTGPYVLNVTAEPSGTNSVGNDECAGAIPITPGTSCSPQTFTNGCASQSRPAVDCGIGAGVANDDVWYSFTATNSEMSIGVLPSASGNMNPVIELFTGGCGSLVSLDCADDGGQNGSEDLQASGLAVGTTYYFRVYDYRIQYSWLDPNYELCVVEGLGSGVGLEEVNGAQMPTIYPNPTAGDFTIRVDRRLTRVNIDVFDATGRTVIAQQLQTSGGVVNMTTAGLLNPGIYVVRIDDGITTKSERLIVR